MAGKLQKTAKELTDMLWDALKRANAIGFGDYKIRVFPIKVGPSDWDAEITSTQKPCRSRKFHPRGFARIETSVKLRIPH